MNAVKRYPFEIARSAGVRRIEYCANSKIAVSESFTNIAVT
jgi:hypothetical protein